MQTSSYKPMQL